MADHVPEESLPARQSRRTFMKTTGVAALGVALPNVLAACGSSGESTSSTSAAASAATSAEGAALHSLIGAPAGKAAGQGLTIKLGLSAGLSGPGAEVYGQGMVRGVQVAVEQIKAAGGPTLQMLSRDNGEGNANKTTSYMREFGGSGVPVMLTSFAANGGSEFPFYEQFKVLGLDCGTAPEQPVVAHPFYYVAATIPGANSAGLVEYLKASAPDVTRVSTILLDLGPTVLAGYKYQLSGAVTRGGLTLAGEVVYSSYTQTDFSPQIAKLKSQKPQAIFGAVYGPQLGYLLKQLAAAGMGDVKVFSYDYSPAVSKIAGPVKEWYYASPYFNPQDPKGDWEKLYFAAYRKQFGGEPTSYTTNYYQATMIIWQLVMRIIAAGADPTKPGDHWVTALESDPEFKAALGGNGKQNGVLGFDTKTHLLDRQLNAAYGVPKPGTTEILSTFNMDGADYQPYSA